jgi:hypothetical protein
LEPGKTTTPNLMLNKLKAKIVSVPIPSEAENLIFKSD